MEATFIGHQSWLITEGDTNILIDPILENNFGNSDENCIEIYPPREIIYDRLPKIDAIILSHEHSDHFNLPSLMLFPGVPIYVGPLMINLVKKLIVEAGLIVETINFKETIQIGNMLLRLYPSGNETVLWESRVSQIYISSLARRKHTVFIAVDSLISDAFKNDIINTKILFPHTVFVSNNSQIVPKGFLRALDNCRGFNEENEFIGVDILHEILIDYFDDIDEVKNIVICGGGFTKKYDTFFGSFPMSNQKKLAEIADYFSIDKTIIGPQPGDVISLENKAKVSSVANWIKINKTKMAEINQIETTKVYTNEEKCELKMCYNPRIAINNEIILKELKLLCRAFMLSTIGGKAIDYLNINKTLHPYGLLIRLLGADNKIERAYALDFNMAKFVEILNLENIIEDEIPFGVECYNNDFNAIILGKMQIWDVASVGIKSWYIGSRLDSPVAFLYNYFGEQAFPEMNYKCYQERWKTVFKRLNEPAGVC